MRRSEHSTFKMSLRDVIEKWVEDNLDDMGVYLHHTAIDDITDGAWSVLKAVSENQDYVESIPKEETA